MIKKLKGGGTLITGDDLSKHFENMFNRRNNFTETCDFCKHDEESDRCTECSIKEDISCSCHINPPCYKCVNSGFEATKFIINYKNHCKGKTQWECFPSNEKVFDKFNLIEKEGFTLSAEILRTTGEVAMYIDSGDESTGRDLIQVSRKVAFKQEFQKLILDFKLKESI